MQLLVLQRGPAPLLRLSTSMGAAADVAPCPLQALREQIVPSARAYPLNALMADCQEYFR